MSCKKVFTVKLSEDGLSGVYTNKKLCWEAIERTNYFNNEGRQTYIESFERDSNGDYKADKKATYANFCKAFKDCSTVVIKSYNISVEVETFYLND